MGALREAWVVSPEDRQPAVTLPDVRTQVLHRDRAHGLSTVGDGQCANGEGKNSPPSTWH